MRHDAKPTGARPSRVARRKSEIELLRRPAKKPERLRGMSEQKKPYVTDRDPGDEQTRLKHE